DLSSMTAATAGPDARRPRRGPNPRTTNGPRRDRARSGPRPPPAPPSRSNGALAGHSNAALAVSGRSTPMPLLPREAAAWRRPSARWSGGTAWGWADAEEEDFES